MKHIFYDGLGINAWLFEVFQHVHIPGVQNVWAWLAYAYGWWVAPAVALALCARYMHERHRMSAGQLAAMSRIMALLILSFALIWCMVYTLQMLTLWPRPWMLYPGLDASVSPLPWHEGFPASAPAMAMMVACIFWGVAGRRARVALVAYVVAGSVVSIVAGQSWPADVAFGLLVGAAGVRLARLYYGYAVRRVSS